MIRPKIKPKATVPAPTRDVHADVWLDTTQPPEARVALFLRDLWRQRQAATAEQVAFHCDLPLAHAEKVLHGLTHANLPGACVTWQDIAGESVACFQWQDPLGICLHAD